MAGRKPTSAPTRKGAVYIGVSVLMAFLILSEFSVALYFGMFHKEADYLKLVIVNLGLLFSALLFVYCFFRNHDNTTQRHIFATISALIFFNILFSGVMDMLDGIAGTGTLLTALQTLTTVISIVTHFLFWLYQRTSLPQSKAQRYFSIWIYALMATYLVLLAINCFTGFLFYGDSDGRLNFPGFAVECLLTSAYYVSYLLYVLPQHCPAQKKLSVASFAFFPLLYVLLSIVWILCGAAYFNSTAMCVFLLLAAYVVFFGDYISSKDLLLHQKAELAEQKNKQTELQTALMLSQIQPHFLYNALTAIRSLCRKDPEKAYVTLGQFADYLRGNMDALGSGRIITFEKELEHTKTYLTLEQLRFGEDLNVEYDIRYMDFLLPALTVQPIVENAVRHGATMNEDGGTVTIRSEKSDEGAVITVTDNGPGFDPQLSSADDRSHLGIENVRNCLRINGYGELQIDSTPGAGTTVTIRIREKKSDAFAR